MVFPFDIHKSFRSSKTGRTTACRPAVDFFRPALIIRAHMKSFVTIAVAQRALVEGRLLLLRCAAVGGEVRV